MVEGSSLIFIDIKRVSFSDVVPKPSVIYLMIVSLLSISRGNNVNFRMPLMCIKGNRHNDIKSYFFFCFFVYVLGYQIQTRNNAPRLCSRFEDDHRVCQIFRELLKCFLRHFPVLTANIHQLTLPNIHR